MSFSGFFQPKNVRAARNFTFLFFPLGLILWKKTNFGLAQRNKLSTSIKRDQQLWNYNSMYGWLCRVCERGIQKPKAS
jgi:hypothetical protein